MTEEDAKKVTALAGRKSVHILVKVNKVILDKTGKFLYAQTIGRGLKAYENRTRVYQGPHALKDFIDFSRANRSAVGRIDVDQTDFKEFAAKCKKNHVDFAMVRDKSDTKVVHFFFQGKHAEAMSYLFEEYAREKFKQESPEMISEGDREKEALTQTQEEKDKEKEAVKAKEEKSSDKKSIKSDAKEQEHEDKSRDNEAEIATRVKDRVLQGREIEREMDFEK